MIEIIRSQEKERLALRLQRIRDRNVALDDELMTEVAAIIREVRTRGDAALIDFAARFDGVVMQPIDLRVPEETLRSTAATSRFECPRCFARSHTTRARLSRMSKERVLGNGDD